MRPARALLGFIIFVFVGGALISPWVFEAVLALGVQNVPFRRVVDRCLIGLALIGLWPLVKALGIRSTKEIGLAPYPNALRDWGLGILIGSTLLLIAACVSLGVGAAEWQSRTGWGKQIGSAIATGIIIALLEEILFRGAIYTALSRVWGWVAGLWASSAIYGIFHFFARPENPVVVRWDSGFVVLGRMLKGFTDIQQVIPGLFSLTLLGVIFVLAFRRTGALIMSMGIHASLVFWVKLFGFAARTSASANTWFWGSEKLIDGWFCFILLCVVTMGFARIKPRSP